MPVPYEPPLSGEVAARRNGLRTGFTTGTCASAAAKAAAIGLITSAVPRQVEVGLPGGTRVSFPVEESSVERDASGCTVSARAVVVKDAGDDPDCTHGARMTAQVSWVEAGTAISTSEDSPGLGSDLSAGDIGYGFDVELRAGPGIGTVTKPGLGLAVGLPAINPVPRRMILAALAEAFSTLNQGEKSVENKWDGSQNLSKTSTFYATEARRGPRQPDGQPSATDPLATKTGAPYGRRIVVTFSVPGGEAMASKTSNERLGIIGGISILGTTGIVKPFSTASYRASVVQQVDVAAAQHERTMVLCTGTRSERAAMRLWPELDQVCFVEAGDFTGVALRRCAHAGMKNVRVVAMVGKIAKLAAGVMMTHFHRSKVDTAMLAQIAEEAGAPSQVVQAATATNTARHFFEACLETETLEPLHRLCASARDHCESWVAGAFACEVVMVDFEGQRVVARA